MRPSNFKQLLLMLNDLPVFDPSRWPRREFLSRLAAILIIGFFILVKLRSAHLFPATLDTNLRYYQSLNRHFGQVLFTPAEIQIIWGLKLITWLIETGILAVYIVSYLIRSRAQVVAKGFMEVVFPIIVAGLPVLMSFMPYNLPRYIPMDSRYHFLFYTLIMGFILLGGLLNLVGLITLRRAFTIMSEARTLITDGIFRYLRHPLYTGHFIMFFGSLCLRLHAVTTALYLLFVAGQFIRAGIEEKKLQQAFPEYAAYKEKTGRFLPKVSMN